METSWTLVKNWLGVRKEKSEKGNNNCSPEPAAGASVSGSPVAGATGAALIAGDQGVPIASDRRSANAGAFAGVRIAGAMLVPIAGAIGDRFVAGPGFAQ